MDLLKVSFYWFCGEWVMVEKNRKTSLDITYKQIKDDSSLEENFRKRIGKLQSDSRYILMIESVEFDYGFYVECKRKKGINGASKILV